MKDKIKLGQFYTKRSQYIIGNLIKDLDKNKIVVEPFCGEGDLLIFENEYEIYDIEPKIDNCIKRDTLIYPPDYTHKLVVTNPPFLARNKNKNKELYDLYNVGDLYKAAIKSIMTCEGGILIIPLNFFSDEDNDIRNIFFNRFQIIQLNIFEETVFDDTSYTICSFSFKLKENNENISEIKCVFFPSNMKRVFTIDKNNGWKIGAEFYNLINIKTNIKRLRIGGIPNSNLYLRCIDTGSTNGRISLSINKNHYYGKETDRSFATLVLDKEYTIEQEEIICKHFNEILENYRNKYNSMFLTNFRNSTSSYARKRISFDVAYKLIEYIIKKEGF